MFYAQIKISTLQDRILRTRESSPLLRKARNSTRRNASTREQSADSVFFFAVDVSSISGETRAL